MTLLPQMRVLAQQAPDTPSAALGSASVSDAPAASTPSADETSQTGQLQEVTVTAQRVRENLQRVPIAVNAATGVQLQQAGVTSVQALNTLVPNVVNTGFISNYTYIRGIGSSNASINNEAAVSTYVDGVYMASPYGNFGTFNNISRIEVLKGPQGTLFGRDTTGGVIQIITPDPSHTFSANFEESYGNYDTFGGKGYLTAGLTDTMAADVAVVFSDQKDGYGTDLCPDLKAGVCSPAFSAGRRSDFGGRSKWLWNPWDATKIVFEADYDRFRAQAGLQMAPGSVDPLDHVTTYYGRYNFVGIPYTLDAQQYGGSLHVDQDIGSGLHFVSITSWRQLFGSEVHNNSRTPNNALYTITENSRGTYQTQEFQLIDQNPGRVTWLLGGYYFGDVVGYDPRSNVGSQVKNTGFLAIQAFQTVRSYSGYGQMTADLFSQVKLDLSARYTSESVALDGYYADAAGRVVNSKGGTAGAAVYDRRIKYNPWTYRAALDRQFGANVMGYLSFTHGFKSGGFNLPSPDGSPFLPETINSYEVGEKAELLNHRLRLNLALYYYQYNDIQVVIVPGLAGQLFTNAAGAHANGVDADFAFAATDKLTLRAAFGYVHGYYTDYPNAQRFTAAGLAVAIPNAAGSPLPYAPPYSGNVGLNYSVPTSIGDFVLSPTVAYTSKYPFTVDQNFQINRTIMVNAQLEWDSRKHDGLAVRLWGNNLANQYTYVSPVESSGGWYGVPGAPRTYGITVLERF
jgi:iron complex outermembrane receptor protein